MKSYIADFVSGDEVTSYFLVSDAPTVRKSKKDTEYASFELLDKTGKIDARLWTIPPGLDLSLLAKIIVKVSGQVSEWKDQKQISVAKIRLSTKEDNVDLTDFFECSPFSVEEMWDQLWDLLFHGVKHVPGVTNPFVSSLLLNLLRENKENFCKAPAAKGVHHAYLGGLLEHTLSLCKTTLLVSERYDLDRSLMLAACVLHDIGKIRELTYDMGLGYSVEGSLIGHISIGMTMVSEAVNVIENFPQNLKILLLHLIVSHHGLLAYGSPKIPATKEAIAFHLIDMLDSKMGICDRIAKEGFNSEGMSAWSKHLETPLFNLPERA